MADAVVAFCVVFIGKFYSIKLMNVLERRKESSLVTRYTASTGPFVLVCLLFVRLSVTFPDDFTRFFYAK